MTRARRPHVAERTSPIDGRPIRFSGRTARELAADLERFERLRYELRRGSRPRGEIERELRRLQHGAPTVEAAARAYASSGVAETTRRNVESFVRNSGAPFARLDLEALDAAKLDKWVRSLSNAGRARSSIVADWRLLRQITRHAMLAGWISDAPWGQWSPRVSGLGDPIEREAARDVGELLALVEAAAEMDAERAARGLLPDVAPKVSVCALLGLRQGELGGLRWSDLDASTRLVRIVRQTGGRRPKTRVTRELLAPPELFELLDDWRAVLARRGFYAPGGPVFPCRETSTPERVRAYEARTDCLRSPLVREAARRAKLPNAERWSARSLRDTFVTLESRARAGDLRALQARTGHKSITSLVRYVHRLSRGPIEPGFTLPRPPAPTEPPQLGR